MARQTQEAKTQEPNTFTREQIVSIIRDEVALILRGAAGQTAHMISVRGSADVETAYLDAQGGMLVQRGAFGNNAAPDGGTLIRLSNRYLTDIGTIFGIDMDLDLQYDAESSSTANAAGLAITTSGDFGPAQMTGFFVEVQAGSNNDFTNIWGLFFAGYHTGSGDVDNLFGAYFGALAGGSGTVNNMYGAYIDAPDGQTDTINTMYGLYIANQNAGAANYGIYTNAGLNSVGDDFEFRNATDGPILIDRTTATRYRLFVDGGVLGIEPV